MDESKLEEWNTIYKESCKRFGTYIWSKLNKCVKAIMIYIAICAFTFIITNENGIHYVFRLFRVRQQIEYLVKWLFVCLD